MLPVPLRARLERCPSLPTLPTLAVRILALCRREDVNASDVAQALASDASLAAHVLRIANSPAMALRAPSKTVRHAVALLGLTAVRTAALSFLYLSSSRRPHTAAEQAQWRRSIISAIGAQELAFAAGAAGADEAFLAALLQDSGMLALMQGLKQEYAPILAAAAGDHGKLAELEREAFGCDHAEVGSWLLARWGLPESLVSLVGSSHGGWSLAVSVGLEATELLPIVALSGWIADLWVRPDTDEIARLAAKRAKLLVGFSPEQFELVLDRVAASLHGEIAQLLQLDPSEIGAPEDTAKLLDRVRQAIAT